jgi:hypothetical protein
MMTIRARLGKLTIGHLWALTSLLAIFILLNTYPIRPHDFWWHLQAGRELVTTGHIPSGDRLSFTVPGKSYGNYATFWLVEALLYLLYQAGGPAWVVLAHSLALTAGGAVLLYLCWRISRNWRMSGLAVLFYFALAFNDWNIRPQSIAFLLGPIYLLAVYESRWRFRWWMLAVLAVVMALWANSHGSFFIGLLMVGIWVADEAWQVVRRRLQGRGAKFKPLAASALAAIVSVGACLANPRGLGIFAYVRDLSGTPVVRQLVPEWAPPSFATVAGGMFLCGLLLCAVMLAVSPARPGFFQIITFLLFGVLGLLATRAAAWFGMCMAPVVALHLTALRPAWQAIRGQDAASHVGAPESDRPPSAQGTRAVPASRHAPRTPNRMVLNYVFLGTLVAVSAVSLPWFKELLPLPDFKRGLVSRETPIAATDFLLREQLPGPVFNDLGFGSYLIWEAQPEYPVFIDPRLELYPWEVVRDYLGISAALEGWERRLETYGINTLMLSPDEQGALVQAAAQSPNWRLVYRDPAAVLFVRAGD